MTPYREAPEPARARRAISKVAPAVVSASELEEYYRRYFLPLVRRALRKHGLSMEDAADIVQDAFLLAVGKLEPTGNTKAWFYQVIDYLAANLRRKTVRREHLLARWEAVETRPIARQRSSEEV